MFIKVLIVFISFIVPVWAMAQTSLERSAQRNIKKQSWESAYSALQKALQKDSTSTIAHYLKSYLFLQKANPFYNIDSAYYYAEKARLYFLKVSDKEREKIKRFPVDSALLVKYRKSIEAIAYDEARSSNTERAYTHYLKFFPYADQQKEVKDLQREAAFQEVLLLDSTHTGFLGYMERYPDAPQVNEAAKLHALLLYKSETANQTLTSFKKFVETYPTSPFKAQAEEKIFQISTASGELKDFTTFLIDYPLSKASLKARNILYHLVREKSPDTALPAYLQTDSLVEVERLSEGYLIPFLSGQRFGFMNHEGDEVVQPELTDIHKDYLCGNITDDILVLSNRIVSRKGTPIFKGEVLSADDLGSGFLKIETENCLRICHKSGFVVGDSCVEDGKVLNEKMIALKKHNVWSIWTLSGVKVQPYQWDNVAVINNVLVLERALKKHLVRFAEMASVVNQKPLLDIRTYDDVKPWQGNNLWVKEDAGEGVVNQQLESVIPIEPQTLTRTFYGATATRDTSFVCLNTKGFPSVKFKAVEVAEPWTAVYDSAWRLYNVANHQYSSQHYDSIKFSGPFAFGYLKDSVAIHFPSLTKVTHAYPLQLEFIPGHESDSSSFLLVGSGKKQTVYRHTGELLFNTSYDKIQYAGQNLFIIHRNEKKGLANYDGKILLPAEYDAIGTIKDGIISLLKNTNFGLYNVTTKKIIKPQYVKNVVPYSQHLLVAFKDGYVGLIGWDNKPASKFEFSEIQFWNDTLALVKKNNFWNFYNIKKNRIDLANIRDVKLLNEKSVDKVAIIREGNDWGVVSSKRGFIIPIRFSDIVNVGSTEHPTYFTEKHVEEASIFVVIYYNGDGKMLRREVSERDHYERIYCSN